MRHRASEWVAEWLQRRLANEKPCLRRSDSVCKAPTAATSMALHRPASCSRSATPDLGFRYILIA